MKQYFVRFRQSTFFWPFVGGLSAVVLVGVVLVLLLGGGKDSSQDSKDGSLRGGSGKGTSLQSNISDLIGSTQSTSNLVGLTLRINQIDVCELPDLAAYVAVTSESGDVSRLNSDDIEVEVDGKVIDNPTFERIDASEQPLTATLAIDRSGSMAGQPMSSAISAASTFVDRAADKDRLGVISFDHEIQVLRKPTSNLAQVKKDIANISVRGDTALYDVVTRAVEVTDGCSRRAVVLLSDGGDTASKQYSLSEAISQSNKEGLPVFVVGLKGSTYDESTLRKIAEGTGGQLFQTDQPEDLAKLYERIDEQLKGQYQVRLKLDIPKTDKEHRLKITSKVEGSETTSERSFIY